MRAVSDHPTGPFSVVLNEKPDGLRFGDFALYEENGAGYMIWGSHDTHSVFIYSLKPDFVHIDKRLAVIYQGEKREAPAIIKLGQRYLLFTSGKSGWSPNPCHYAWANDVAGPWTKMGEFAVGTGRETTFRSQSTELIEHDGTLIYMGDDDKDEQAFEVVQSYGGVAIRVCSNVINSPIEDWRLDDPKAAREWLWNLTKGCS